MKAVLFDIYGFIVDTEPLSDLHDKKYLPKIGVDTSKKPLPQSIRGLNAKSFWILLKKEYNLKEDVNVLIDNGRASYLEFLKNTKTIPVISGACELISQLLKSNYRLAIASSANPKRIDMLLDRLDMKKYFEVIVSGDDVTHGKPHPEVFLLTAFNMDVNPSDCIVIEDAAAGVKAAKAADMFCIAYSGSTHNNENLSDADIQVNSFSKLAKWIKDGGNIVEFSDKN